MMRFLGADGQPLGIVPNLLVVPPQLEDEALNILKANIINLGTSTTGAGVSNVYMNSAELLVVPEMANLATTWYMMDVSRPIKPIVWQQRRAPELVAQDQPDNPTVFNTRQYTWGIDSRGAIGYSLWFLAARCIA